MKQVTIISGKGGTGKTSLTAAFAYFAENAVLADCDVDASDLHLLLRPEVKKTIGFHGLAVASIDDEKCINCKTCVDHCQFNAISDEISIQYNSCEGCGVCAFVCPVDAVKMKERDSGLLYESETRFGPMVHASLNAAEESSGKLVTSVRSHAEQLALQKDQEIILIDGPPGIGCPVISAITGVDLVVIVTEPTISGIHDFHRIIELADHFSIPKAVIINKKDINGKRTAEIETFCQSHQIPLIGSVPYNLHFTSAMIEEKVIPEYETGELSETIHQIWLSINKLLTKKNKDHKQ